MTSRQLEEVKNELNKGSNQSSKRRFLIVNDGIISAKSQKERQLLRTYESLNIADELVNLGRKDSFMPRLSESQIEEDDESEQTTPLESKKQLPILKKPMN
jgi:hypothetical protein